MLLLIVFPPNWGKPREGEQPEAQADDAEGREPDGDADEPLLAGPSPIDPDEDDVVVDEAERRRDSFDETPDPNAYDDPPPDNTADDQPDDGPGDEDGRA